MTIASILVLPDFSKPFGIKCDAFGKSLSVILPQDQRPISYFSKALASNSLSKSVYKKELMALVLAIQYWRNY